MENRGRGYAKFTAPAEPASGYDTGFGRGQFIRFSDPLPTTGKGRGVKSADVTYNPPSIAGYGRGIRKQEVTQSGIGGKQQTSGWPVNQDVTSSFENQEPFSSSGMNLDRISLNDKNDWDWPIASESSSTNVAAKRPDRAVTENRRGTAPTGVGFYSYNDPLATSTDAETEVGSRNRDFGGFGSQTGLGNKCDFGNQGGFGNQSSFGSQGGFGNKCGFENEGGFGNQAGFGSQSGFDLNSQTESPWSQGFGDITSTDKRSYGRGFKSKKTFSGCCYEGFDNNAGAPRDPFKDLPPILKDFYVEDPEIAGMSEDEVAALKLALFNISVTDQSGKNRKPSNPVKTFAQAFSAYPDILKQIEQQNFKQPSPIQSQMWPIALCGIDVIGIAQTGTGKTLGFLLPIFIHLDGQPNERTGPGALILTPTRELAKQIHSEVKKYQYKNMKDVCLYGGGSRSQQVSACNAGVDIIIATPGRLRDLSDDDTVDLSTITFVVLDEADRMLDMGFEPDIRWLLRDIRPDRQTVLTSATWPEGVRKMAESYTKDPFLITVGSLDLTTAHGVTQQVFVVDQEEKKEFLVDFLTNMKSNEKVIVFVGKKITADHLASFLTGVGIKCQSIHGDREQIDREKALSDLKKGVVKILVATDVASRGLDICDVTHVFIYDFPQAIEEYVHRIGRTGRAGKSGVSITLMTRSDWHHSTRMIQILTDANQEVPQDLIHMSERYEAKKAELGAAAVDPKPFSRRRKEGESRKKDATFFDPYTGEPYM